MKKLNMKNNYNMMDSYNIIESNHIDMINRLNLERYFISIDGKWSPDFVGFILTEEETIISFPKHYYSNNNDIKDEDIRLLSKLMIKARPLEGLNNEDGLYNNFPLYSYLYICNYYNRYGLYNRSTKKKQRDYKGRIDWRSTIRKSNKIISETNLIFMPFIIEKSITLEVLLTECMIYVLDEGFNRFGKFFGVGVNISRKTNNPIFGNKRLIIKQLSLLKSEYFKDSERLLIDHLIQYFKWSNSNKDKTILITKNFEGYWELLVQSFMNRNLYNIKVTGELIFKKNFNNYNFRKETEIIESKEVIKSGKTRNFNVEYDHLYITLDNVAYLFDSKYYKEIKNLDYKQIAYNYILKSSEIYINREVVNGLILPTEKEYHHRVHVDTRDREGLLEDLFIIEHYLNVKEVIKSFIAKD